jgi:ubiquitin C-terminal hydrolase
MKELGFQKGHPKGNTVYTYSKYDLADICKLHSKELKELNIRVTKENCHIPYLYWTSKQHKNPYKFRFIAGAKHCTTKQISAEVALALKCIKQQFKNYCRVIKKHSGISHFWSVDNSHEVVNKLKNITANSLETYDFSTLYTNLPLDIIYKDLESLIIKMYRNSGSHTLLVNPQTKKCFWYQGNFYAGYKKYTIDKLLKALHFILNETYIQFAGFIFQQTVGIPMGGNASPFIADLFLAWREYKFISENLKNNFALVKALSNNSRYIDDILVLNHLDFGKLAKEIYPKQLILEKSSPFTKRENFLDLHIRIIDNVFITGIYHKVDDFNFEVINFPFPDSNIDTSLGYKTFYSQLVRFARLCSCREDFYHRTQLTFNKLLHRGYDCASLRKYFFRFCSKYNWVLAKYNHSSTFTFWKACLQFDKIISVKTCDTSSIKALTKEIKIELTDLYAKHKKGYALKQCSIKLNEQETILPHLEHISIIEDKNETSVNLIDTNSDENSNLNSDTNSDENSNLNSDTNSYENSNLNSVILSAPIGITNPKNHCYLNSVIQILLCIFHHHPQSLDNINDNEEGTILCYFKEILHTDFKFVYTLKQHLAKYNPKLTGVYQQDANECFNILCNILDTATKYSLLGDDNAEEAFICKFTKEMFSHTIKTSRTCTICKNSDDIFSTSSIHVVTPKHNQNINTLISGSDVFSSPRSCIICNENSVHQYSKEIFIVPKVLVVLINRFGYVNGISVKNKFNISIDERFTLKGCAYELIGIIHHHGQTAISGHYTAWVKYNQFFVCNDVHVKPVNIHENIKTDTGYILIYNRT